MNDEKMIAAMVFAESLELPSENTTLDARARYAILAGAVFGVEWDKHRAAEDKASNERYEKSVAERRYREEVQKIEQAKKDADDQRIIAEAVKAALAAVAEKAAK